MQDKKASVIMIGNSHIDPVWLWREREGLQEIKATFSSVLDRMEEFEEFQFTGSSAAFYAWLQKYCPAVFAKIAERVREGRWHLAGGWWVEPDMNIPGGESMVRQGLYGQRFFKEAFGKMAETAYLVDSFGHSAGLAKIFRGQTLQGFVFMRPQPHEIGLPSPLFLWEDEDGSRVKALQIQGEYCAWTRRSIVDNLNKSLTAIQEHQITSMPVFYGVGNHGGGPTIENIKAIRELKKEHPELSMENGSLDAYFQQVSEQPLPIYQGELEGCFPGCYTVDSEIKRLCRLSEELLVKAETLSAMAMELGFVYPARELREAWQLLLFQQFHDTMAGTARKEARDDACDDMRRCLSIGREVIGGALQAASAAIDTRGDGAPLLLVNTCDAPFEGVVDADIYWRSKHPMRLKNAEGEEIPYDFSSRDIVSPDTRKHLVFRASVPAFGCAVYRMIPEAAQIPMESMACEKHVLENRFLRIEFDDATGCPRQLYNKQSGQELLNGPASLIVYEDRRDTWGAKGEIGPCLGTYKLMDMAVIEEGNIRTSLRARLAFGKSEASLIWSLAKDDPFFTLDAHLDNHETLSMTSLRFPFGNMFSTVIAEGPYSEQERPYSLQGERHCQRYCDLLGEDSSLLIVNEAKYGYRVFEQSYEILISRSPIHAFGSCEVPQKNHDYTFCDQGLQRFSLQLRPHGLDMDRLDRARSAQRFHRPVEVLCDSQHEGGETLRRFSFLSTEGLAGVMIHLVKQGEEEGLVFRLQNMTGIQNDGVIVCGRKQHPISCAPYQLMTVRISPQGECQTINLLELN